MGEAHRHRPALPTNLAATPRLSRWIEIRPDGTALVSPGKVEIGQGILTALQQIVADELDLPLERVVLRPASTDYSPDEGVTSGSLSVQNCGAALAQAGAEVRAAFLEAAALRLGVDAAALDVEDGVIRGPGNAGLSYAELAESVDLDRDAAGVAAPKPLAARRLRGRSVPRADIAERVFARRPYLHDLTLPDLLHGRIVRSELAHARLVSLDDAPARGTPGCVAVVRDGDFLGVIATSEAAAELCRARLARGAVWEATEPLPDPADLAGWLRSAPHERTVIDRHGNPGGGVRKLGRDYLRPFLAHGSIAPSCAIAQWHGGRLQVWTHSQGVFNLRAELALVLGIDRARISVAHVEGAGCYGHNGADDVALDTALLARAAGGRPVRVQWSRQDELGKAPFGAAQLVRIEAELDAAGRLVAWRHTIWSNGHTARPGRAETPALRAATELAKPWPRLIPVNSPQARGGGADRNAVPLYDFPHREVVSHRLLTMPVRTSSLRSLGAFANVFAIESFMDELAEEVGADPLAFRLDHLSDPRALAVLRAAAERSGWGEALAGEARGRGLAVARYKGHGAYCAAVAEVTVDETVRVDRLVLAVDVGDVVTPDGVANQVEGGAIQAASWVLKEAVRFDRERITSVDWDSYPILRFSEVPETIVEIVERPDQPAVGAGECAHGPVAGAIGNAVAKAVGVRVRRLPIDRDAVIAAMQLG
jgi:CO/xanthine dehydrogenase Mo-binding subunit